MNDNQKRLRQRALQAAEEALYKRDVRVFLKENWTSKLNGNESFKL